MRKTRLSLFLLLILVVSIFPITCVQAIVAFTDGFEDSTFNKWDGNGVTSWIIGSIGHTGDKSAQCTETQDGDLKSDDIDLSGATGASIDMWIQKDDTEPAEFILYYWNGVSYDQIVDLDLLGADDGWINYQVDIASDYWISDFHLRIWGNLDKNENCWIDDVVIDKVEGGTNHYATASQTLSWAGSNYRDWTLKRTFSQAVSFSSDSTRTWSLTRTLTQAFNFNSNVGKTWDLSRIASQSITFTSNALADLLRIIQRTASLTINFVSNISRSWMLARGVIQTIYIDSYAGRTWNTSRTVTQSITFNSNALATILSLIQRTASLGLNLVVNSTRGWTLKRILSQGISFASNVQGQIMQAYLWLLSLVVTDLDSISLENAVVSLTRNNSGVTNYWKTDINGSIPDQLLSPDDYLLEISKLYYLTEIMTVSLTGNVSLSLPLEGAWMETNPEILGLFGVCLIMQLCYAYGLYKGTQPTLTLTAGVLTALSWYTTGQVVLSFNQVQGVPIALLLSGFSTVNVVLLFRIVYALMMYYQEA